MTVPTNFLTAIQSGEFAVGRWLEIEGIPYAFGTFGATAAFFAGRATDQQFLGIQSFLKHPDPPKNIDQQIDTLEGGSLTRGQTEFELVDVDGSITQWAGIGYLTDRLYLRTDLGYADNIVSFQGNAVNYVAGDYIYIGTETIKIGARVGNTFVGCQRAQFRSKAQDFGKGFPVSKRPYTMAKRRCWYNQVAQSGQGPRTLTGLDANRAIRFSGTLNSFRVKDNELSTYVLVAVSIDAELDRMCFRQFRSFKISSSIADSKGADGAIQVRGWPNFAPHNDELRPIPSDLFPTIENVLLKIDNEIFAARRGGIVGQPNTAVLRLDLRGLFGTDVVAHQDGAVATELIPVFANTTTSTFPSGNNSAAAIRSCSKFTSAQTTKVPLPADHPLMIVLQVLLSTGLGNNTPGEGARNYDVLPKEYGMGIDYDRVDITGIEAAALEEPQLRFGGLVTASENFVSFTRNLLKMAGFYFFSSLGDKLSIKRLRPPYPDVTTKTLNDTKRIRKFVTSWDANWSATIREVVFKFGYDLADQQFKRVVDFVLPNADVYTKGLARTLQIECKLLYPGASNIRGEPPFTPFDVDQWLLNRRDFFQVRYSRPPPVIRERVTYDFMDVNVGELVIVDHSQLPSTVTGARGLTQEIGEIVSKSIEDQSKTILFDILLTGYSLGRYRFIAPSFLAVEWTNPSAASPAFRIEANSFTAATGPTGKTQTDYKIEDSSGILQPAFSPIDGLTNFYTSSFPVRVWKSDFSRYADKNIEEFDPVTLIMSLSGGDDLDFINFAGGEQAIVTYQGEAQMRGFNLDGTDLDGDGFAENLITPIPSTYAFGVKADDAFASVDEPHRYFPI